jgi:hypothetical protein
MMDFKVSNNNDKDEAGKKDVPKALPRKKVEVQSVVRQDAPQRNIYPIAILNAQSNGSGFRIPSNQIANSTYLSADDR